jgi:hypothetical protein
MQSSSMELSSSLAVKVSPPYDGDTQSSKRTHDLRGFTMIVICCSLCIIGLVISAFSADLKDESNIECFSAPAAVVSETWHTLLTFAMGWLCTMLAKRRRDLSRRVLQIAGVMKWGCSVVHSRSVSAISDVVAFRRRYLRVQQPIWLSKGILGIIAVASLCVLCVMGLLVSAFSAVPDAEPPRDGISSESSVVVRIFTASWIFLLSLKLLHELVGLVGYSCLFQPW